MRRKAFLKKILGRQTPEEYAEERIKKARKSEGPDLGLSGLAR